MPWYIHAIRLDRAFLLFQEHRILFHTSVLQGREGPRQWRTTAIPPIARRGGERIDSPFWRLFRGSPGRFPVPMQRASDSWYVSIVG
uniref:Uncharacterized protein n=1 Tax=Candidatus Kentrum eta TaxID=2126337 RepID=A0A450UXJ7_9GAMM|nr:MAG: hypothetical protein BECKH772A_GA0070896_101177 [Candidatus Kentron sp. H]VFJ97761.1 MAG: hypothetical protein BECKH772B_GA0070898_101187 [Candidatus Kentron sp. H]VFK03094.1 MAG: hypothetical protein BECKH772C_GA0070978_101137 [Candidatus Kentron sp. H]